MTENNRRSALQCLVAPLGQMGDYVFVVVVSEFQGKLMLSRHRDRDTWETQGGHIEPGETPLEAARRELYEESGAAEFELIPVCDYLGYNATGQAAGQVFYAKIARMGPMPESEMAETRLFDALPENLTYPQVTPKLYAQARLLQKEKENRRD